MAHSTIPAVKNGLVAQLKARSALTAVQVSYARPADDRTERESIWLGAAGGNQTFGPLGPARKKRDEVYLLHLHVQVSTMGNTASENEQRAANLAGELEDLLADDPSIGGVLIQPAWAGVSGYELTVEGEDEGYVAVCTVAVEVHARLT